MQPSRIPGAVGLFLALMIWSAFLSIPASADINEPQVSIEAKIIETTQNDIQDLGVNFHHGDQIGGQLEDMDTARNLDHSGIPGLGSPLPATSGAAFGDNVGVMVQALQSENNDRIVQAPKLLALDNQEATIFVGETIRYSEATPTVIPQEGGVQLQVVPEISSEDRITMQLNVTVEGFASITLPEIDVRFAQTELILASGATAVLGGLVRESEVIHKDKIPFFGDIPYLGLFFKSSSKSETKRNLLVFVTPRILKSTN